MTIMSCPRNCGIDIRNHHSSDKVNGGCDTGCDTGPMSLEEMTTWFELRAERWFIAELIEAHYGMTEDELNELYTAMHGSMA